MQPAAAQTEIQWWLHAHCAGGVARAKMNCIKNDEFCIKHDEGCIKNDGFNTHIPEEREERPDEDARQRAPVRSKRKMG